MVVTIDESAVQDEIMNMITICRRAACSTEDPPRIAPVIMPGMEMRPMTLGESQFRAQPIQPKSPDVCRRSTVEDESPNAASQPTSSD